MHYLTQWLHWLFSVEQIIVLRGHAKIPVVLNPTRTHGLNMLLLMLKARPLCTSVELNLGDRVLDEVEKNSLGLPWWHSG